MTDKRRFFVLLIIAILSIGLLLYAKTHIGANFVNQL